MVGAGENFLEASECGEWSWIVMAGGRLRWFVDDCGDGEWVGVGGPGF